jgi:hypothetical protein
MLLPSNGRFQSDSLATAVSAGFTILALSKYYTIIIVGGRQFTYIMKKKKNLGIDLWGTPCFIVSQL